MTLTGGDPLYQPAGVGELVGRLKALGVNVWLYTGFTFEDVMAHPRLRRAVSDVDVMVDGPFVEALRDETLLFRGSSNQRIIDMRRSTASEPVLLEYNPFI